MLGDSLLDFLQVYSLPAILFDLRGRVLFVNKAVDLLDGAGGAGAGGGHEESTLKQLEEALHASDSFNTDTPLLSSLYTSRIRSPAKDFKYSKFQPAAQDGTGSQQYQPPDRQGKQPPHLLSRQSSSYSSSSSSSSSASGTPLSNGKRSSSSSSLSGSTSPSAMGNEDAATPTGIEEQQRVLWKITITPCRRVLALAQSNGQDPLPELDNRTADQLRTKKPVVRLRWQDVRRFDCLKAGGGEMGDRIRSFDWASHPLGKIDQWPQARVEMVAMVINSPVPMTAYLENDAYVIYNDTYIPVLGAGKHPQSLGKTAFEVWGEIWEYIEVPLQNCLKGIPTARHGQRLFWDRLKDGPNRMEEVYATWYYIPYYSQERVIGNLHMLFEQQNQTNPISQRRTTAISELSGQLSNSRSTIDLCRNALEVLSRMDIDLPYCLAYTRVAYEPPELLTPTGDGTGVGASPDPYIAISSAGSISSKDLESQSNVHVFSLQETIGCAFDSSIAPSRILVDTEEEDGGIDSPGTEMPGGQFVHTPSANLAWQDAMKQMVRTGATVEVEEVHKWLDGVPRRGLPGMTPYRAVLIPLKVGQEIEACVVCLLNPALPWADDFKTFINIIGRQFNLSLSMVKTFEQEVSRGEELAALDRAKTSFFTSISHELRTPLTLILGPIKDLTTDSTLTRAQASSISLVYRNARRLLRLVNSILDFARAEAGKLSSQFSPIPLGIVTAELASSFRSAVESSGMEFRVENNVPEDTMVWIDIDKWEKIVFNLLSNAFKFATKGFIRVSCFTDQQYFYCEVEDTGMGIPADQLSSVFERFVRVENSQARSIEGSGIGLSLTLELVKMHGGKMGVDSTFGHGSTFKIRIPLGNGHLPRQYLVNPNAPSAKLSNRLDEYGLNKSDDLSTFGSSAGTVPAREKNSHVSASDSQAGTDDSPESLVAKSDLWPPLLFVGERQRARILLADDNADLRTFIKSILGKYADVQEAHDGKIAWELLQQHPYDLVLSDIMMPRMTGFQLLAAIRGSEKHKSMPVILLSARAGEEAGVESLSSGADDHLNKPFSSKELILRVHSHLQLAAIRSELETRVNERTAALEESKETFQRLSELLQVGVHRSDRSGRIIWANRKWFAVLGLDYGDWDDWDRRIHPDDTEKAVKYYTQAVISGEGYTEPIEMRLFGPGDAIIDITYELQAERNSAGDCTGFVGVFSDVSSLRRLENERVSMEQARREEAEHNRQLQEHFIDVTCHELRNPLNAISNSAELLGESLERMNKLIENNPDLKEVLAPLSADMQDDVEAVETILLSSRHQKRIADDVLHISKISGNLVQLVHVDWQPELAIQNTLKMYTLEVQAKHIQLSYERDPSLDFLEDTVVGDEGRFVQCALNLLSNALKFVEAASIKKIRVRLGASPVLPDSTLQQLFDHEALALDDLTPLCTPYQKPWPAEDASSSDALLHFSIMDTGPGMSMEEQGRIFKRYAQASPKTYKSFGGVGLGLWISRRLIELHGGAVSLQSEEGVGTIFRLYIKVQKKSTTSLLSPTGERTPMGEVPPRLPEPEKTKIEGRKPRVLAVEDNELNLKILVRLLTVIGCEVTTACDGQEGLNKLDEMLEKGAYPDLICEDLEMPVMDGLTATRHIREREEAGRYPGHVPIVAISANARQQYEDMAIAAGMNSFIRKPFKKADLQAALNHYLAF